MNVLQAIYDFEQEEDVSLPNVRCHFVQSRDCCGSQGSFAGHKRDAFADQVLRMLSQTRNAIFCRPVFPN